MTISNATPQRLYLLQLATSTFPTAGQPTAASTGCYLVQMSDGKNVLIDSGHPAEYQPQPGLPPLEQRKNVLEHLSGLGIRPDEIDLLICSHFDVDHAGYHDAFPNAVLIVQRTHYTLASSGHPRYAATRAHWDHPALHYRLIEGDTELLPGLSLIETSGHAPGHQSVLVHLPQTGKVLLVIDAVRLQRQFTPERRAWPDDDNEEHLRASTHKLLDLVEREQVALVIFGHDGEQWRTLKKAPAYYA
jgi:N-acyl homoserine lactone hydrolase